MNASDCFLKLSSFSVSKKTLQTTFSSQPNLFVYTSPSLRFSGFVACFDMDWTLTRPIRGLFPKDGDDIVFLPSRVSTLKSLSDAGWTICILTNQFSSSEKSKDKIIQRLTKIINTLEGEGVQVILLASLSKDEYRKPDVFMWNYLKSISNSSENSLIGFYVGDAAGRPQDFSDSDKLFAKGVESHSGEFFRFFTPEEFFHTKSIEFNGKRNLVVMVGMQGVGKSSFIQKNLIPKEYTIVESDKYKSNKKKMLSLVKNSISLGENVVVDATNPTLSQRKEYYDVALNSKYHITTVYIVSNGAAFNKLREKPVPNIALYTYLKRLEEPTIKNTPGRLFVLDRVIV